MTVTSSDKSGFGPLETCQRSKRKSFNRWNNKASCRWCPVSRPEKRFSRLQHRPRPQVQRRTVHRPTHGLGNHGAPNKDDATATLPEQLRGVPAAWLTNLDEAGDLSADEAGEFAMPAGQSARRSAGASKRAQERTKGSKRVKVLLDRWQKSPTVRRH